MVDAMKEKCRLCSEEIGYQTFRREGATLVHVSCQNRDIGAREERTDIVAWLRAYAVGIEEWSPDYGDALRDAATEIERGKHNNHG